MQIIFRVLVGIGFTLSAEAMERIDGPKDTASSFCLMHRLPVEINYHILDFLTNSDLRKVRHLSWADKENLSGYFQIELKKTPSLFIEGQKELAAQSSLKIWQARLGMQNVASLLPEVLAIFVEDPSLENLEKITSEFVNLKKFILSTLALRRTAENTKELILNLCLLEKLSKLQEFEFVLFGAVDEGAFEALIKVMRQGCLTKLTALTINRNDCGILGFPSVLKVVNEDQSDYLKNLSRLSLGCNNLGDDGFEILTQSIIQNRLPMITSLALRRNYISDCGMENLGQAIVKGKLKGLTNLNLSGNLCTDLGILYLYRAIESQESQNLVNLTALDMSSNLIKEQGGVLLALTLFEEKLPNLRDLRLSNNSLGDEALLIISGALKENKLKNLKALFLENIGMSQRGADAISLALWDKYKLLKLEIISLDRYGTILNLPSKFNKW